MSHARKTPRVGLGTHRRTGLSLQPVMWAPKVPPGPLLFHEGRPWNCTPTNARYPITVGWTGEAGGRQMKSQMESCQSGNWTQNLRPWAKNTTIITTKPHSNTYTHSKLIIQMHKHTHECTLQIYLHDNICTEIDKVCQEQKHNLLSVCLLFLHQWVTLAFTSQNIVHNYHLELLLKIKLLSFSQLTNEILTPDNAT